MFKFVRYFNKLKDVELIRKDNYKKINKNDLIKILKNGVPILIIKNINENNNQVSAFTISLTNSTIRFSTYNGKRLFSIPNVNDKFVISLFNEAFTKLIVNKHILCFYIETRKRGLSEQQIKTFISKKLQVDSDIELNDSKPKLIIRKRIYLDDILGDGIFEKKIIGTKKILNFYFKVKKNV
jgi:hypothetical protein